MFSKKPRWRIATGLAAGTDTITLNANDVSDSTTFPTTAAYYTVDGTAVTATPTQTASSNVTIARAPSGASNPTGGAAIKVTAPDLPLTSGNGLYYDLGCAGVYSGAQGGFYTGEAAGGTAATTSPAGTGQLGVVGHTGNGAGGSPAGGSAGTLPTTYVAANAAGTVGVTATVPVCSSGGGGGGYHGGSGGAADSGFIVATGGGGSGSSWVDGTSSPSPTYGTSSAATSISITFVG